jgi:hypothetical protein
VDGERREDQVAAAGSGHRREALEKKHYE